MIHALPFSVLASLCCTNANADQRKPVVARKPPVKLNITVSKATTYFTKPLRRDGTVDYIDALNGHRSQGVTVKNNAVVLILQAFGSKDIPKALRSEMFRCLGMQPLSLKGDYYAIPSFGRGGQGKLMSKRWSSQFDRANAHPWKRADCPMIAKWLDDQSQVMKLIDQAARRQKFYLPFVTNESTRLVVDGLDLRLPVFKFFRSAARMFAIRANRHLADGRIDAARRDLTTIHRLARLLARDGFLNSSVVAYAIDQVATAGDIQLALSGRMTSKQALAYRNRLERIGPLNSLPATLKGGERCNGLDFILFVIRAAVRSSSDAKDFEAILPKEVAEKLNRRFGRYFDTDTILKLVNQRFDQFVKVAAVKNSVKRREQAAKLKAESEARTRRLKRVTSFLRSPLSNKMQRVAASRWFAEIIFLQFEPAVAQVIDIEDNTNTRFDLAQISFALAAYRADRGRYPTELKRLAPKYARAVALDRFSGKVPIYRVSKTGFVLYSIGANGKDDGGINTGSKDDIAVRKAK